MQAFHPVLSQPVHRTATYKCDDTRDCIIQFCPPDDEHMCSKHVDAWNKLIIKFSASRWLILINKKSVSCACRMELYRRTTVCGYWCEQLLVVLLGAETQVCWGELLDDCTRNERNEIKWLKAGVRKVGGIRRGFERGKCPLLAGGGGGVKCSDTKKR